MDRQEAFDNLEKAILDYLVHSGPEDSNFDTTGMVLEGWVLQASGRSIGNFRNEVPSTTNAWACGENQPVYATMGLAEMLSMNVGNWYNSGVSLEDED